MKYLIKDTVINADYIRQVVYIPAHDDETSSCKIDMGAVNNWNFILRGKDADLFWQEYVSDAYQVVTK